MRKKMFWLWLFPLFLLNLCVASPALAQVKEGKPIVSPANKSWVAKVVLTGNKFHGGWQAFASYDGGKNFYQITYPVLFLQLHKRMPEDRLQESNVIDMEWEMGGKMLEIRTDVLSPEEAFEFEDPPTPTDYSRAGVGENGALGLFDPKEKVTHWLNESFYKGLFRDGHPMEPGICDGGIENSRAYYTTCFSEKTQKGWLDDKFDITTESIKKRMVNDYAPLFYYLLPALIKETEKNSAAGINGLLSFLPKRDRLQISKFLLERRKRVTANPFVYYDEEAYDEGEVERGMVGVGEAIDVSATISFPARPEWCFKPNEKNGSCPSASGRLAFYLKGPFYRLDKDLTIEMVDP